MSAVLTRIEDPRDNLQKATRDELWDYARDCGVLPKMLDFLNTQYWDIEKGWVPRIGDGASEANVSKPDMENFLRNNGFRNISVAVRSLGKPTGEYIGGDPIRPQTPVSTDHPIEPVEAKPVNQMSIQELRRECKRLGIKLERTDNLAKMREKLNGHQNAA